MLIEARRHLRLDVPDMSHAAAVRPRAAGCAS